jgi:ribosomal protein S8
MREGVNGMKVKICIKLKYKYGESIIREIGLISKSSRRVYMDRNEISKIMGEDKITNFIITTKSGYKTGLEILRSGEGGEVIMYIK